MRAVPSAAASDRSVISPDLITESDDVDIFERLSKSNRRCTRLSLDGCFVQQSYIDVKKIKHSL